METVNAFVMQYAIVFFGALVVVGVYFAIDEGVKLYRKLKKKQDAEGELPN